MDGYQHLRKLAKANKEYSLETKVQAKERAKAALRELQKKRLKTTFIGALDRFEKMFGDLWGHGYPIEELNAVQKDFRRKWDTVRTSILDNGNNQIRELHAETDQFTILIERFHLELSVKENRRFNDE